MKTKYKVLLGLSIAQVIGALFIKKYYGAIKSWWGNVAGVFAFLLPIQICLFLMQRDPDISKRKAVFAKVLFWFITFTFCSGGIATLIES